MYPATGRAHFATRDGILGRMTALETALAAWLAFHAALGVELEAELNPGAAEADIERVEAAIGARLPDDLRTLYRIADGQADPWADGATGEGRWAAMFGRERFLPLDEALAEWRFWHDGIWLPEQEHGGFPADHDVREGDPVDPVYWKPGWFTFAGSDGGNGYAVDLDPPRGGTYGQVVLVGSDEWERRVVASSVTELMADAARLLDPDEPHRFEREEAGAYGEGSRPLVSFDMDWREAPFVPPSEAEIAADEAGRAAVESSREDGREDFDAWMVGHGLPVDEREVTLDVLRSPFLGDPFGPLAPFEGPDTGAAPTRSWVADRPSAWLADLDFHLFTLSPSTGEASLEARVRALDRFHRWRLERGDWTALDYRRSRAVLGRDRPPAWRLDDFARAGSVRFEGDADEIVVERSGPDGERTWRFPSFERLMEGVR